MVNPAAPVVPEATAVVANDAAPATAVVEEAKKEEEQKAKLQNSSDATAQKPISEDLTKSNKAGEVDKAKEEKVLQAIPAPGEKAVVDEPAKDLSVSHATGEDTAPILK